MWSQESELGSEHPRCGAGRQWTNNTLLEQTIALCARRGNYSRWLEFISIRCNWCIMKSEPHAPYAPGSYGVMQGNPDNTFTIAGISIWPLDKLIFFSPVATWPGLTSGKSGRRSDSFQLDEEEVVARRELTYSKPPRSRGAPYTG